MTFRIFVLGLLLLSQSIYFETIEGIQKKSQTQKNKLLQEQAEVKIYKYTDDQLRVDSNSDLQALANEDSGFIKYLVKPINFPKNEQYTTSFNRPLVDGDLYKKQAEFRIGNNGELLHHDGKPIEYGAFAISQRGFLPGEDFNVRYQTVNKKFIKEFTITPNPIVAINSSGEIRAEVHLVTAIPALYAIKFPDPKIENIKMKSLSGDEAMESTLENCHGNILYIPNAVNKVNTKEIGFLEIWRESGEHLKFELPWGDELLDYVKGEKIYSM